MKRLTTDNPKTNLQAALNLFYAKDGEAWVRGGGPEYEYQDVPLFSYIRSVIQHQCISRHLWEELDNETLVEVLTEWLFDGHETKEGIIATLYTAAWAFAEIRERLKAYEDTRLTPEQVAEKKWVPVTERLPKIVKTTQVRRNVYRKSGRVLCACLQADGKRMVKEGYMEFFNDYPEPSWIIPGTIHSVTHWMPLPEPPKGDEQ